MFAISQDEKGTVRLSGRLDAAQVVKAQEVLAKLTTSCIVDFSDLEYISSAGLGILFATQKRLREANQKLTLTNLNSHIRDIFRIARFDLIFDLVEREKPKN
jgi:anti-sigma B factor antagonist